MSKLIKSEASTALSFWQPYAWFIVNGHAEVDSRTWQPPEKRIGERIFVHASKRRLTKVEFADFLETVEALGIKEYPRTVDEFDYGSIIGSVKIQEVVNNSKSYFAHRGYFHWVLRSPRLIKPPIPIKGQRGWFSVVLK